MKTVDVIQGECVYCRRDVTCAMTRDAFRLGSIRGVGGRFILDAPVMLTLERSSSGSWVIRSNRAHMERVAVGVQRYRRHYCKVPTP